MAVAKRENKWNSSRACVQGERDEPLDGCGYAGCGGARPSCRPWAIGRGAAGRVSATETAGSSAGAIAQASKAASAAPQAANHRRQARTANAARTATAARATAVTLVPAGEWPSSASPQANTAEAEMPKTVAAATMPPPAGKRLRRARSPWRASLCVPASHKSPAPAMSSVPPKPTASIHPALMPARR